MVLGNVILFVCTRIDINEQNITSVISSNKEKHNEEVMISRCNLNTFSS